MLCQLSICAFLHSETVVDSFKRSLQGNRFILKNKVSIEDLLEYLEDKQNSVDCLLLEDSPRFKELIDSLNKHNMLFPTVIVLNRFSLESDPGLARAVEDCPSATSLYLSEQVNFYHPGEVQVFSDNLFAYTASEDPADQPGAPLSENASNRSAKIEALFDKAIVQFLQLSPLTSLLKPSVLSSQEDSAQHYQTLRHQQDRLAAKLNERLGYLCVYYKRDPKQFLRHLPRSTAQELLKSMKDAYRAVIFDYFSSEEVNPKVDEFVNLAFFADIPVTRIVEIHMELMDEFSQQLRLENRSEDVLLDYRLTLIDIIAHLCELYRRSIPRES